MQRTTTIAAIAALHLSLCSSPARALVPDRVWGTYVGGATYDHDGGVAVDGAGNVYLCGATGLQTGFATMGVYQDTYGGGARDAFLMRFTPDGERVWATYLGGEGIDQCLDLATDTEGNIYLSGNTGSLMGIATPGALQPNHGGGQEDGFVAKFDATGALLWSSYFGTSSGLERTHVVAAGPDDAIYVAGSVGGSLPFALPGPHDPDFNGFRDIYLLKLTADGALVWGTYYGGAGEETKGAVTVGADAVYLVGHTRSATGIATDDGFDISLSAEYDGFIARFTVDGVREWGTYYGGEGLDATEDAVVMPDGGVTVVGRTASSDLAVQDAHQPIHGGDDDAFLVRMDAAGDLVWATYIGGTGPEYGQCVILDPSGDLLVAGFTRSTTAIATPNAYQPALAGGDDVFIARFTPDGSRQWGTYFGGADGENSHPPHPALLAVDGPGTLYLAAQTTSLDAIATPDAYQPLLGGGWDNFLVRLTNGPGEPCQADRECGDGVCVDGTCVPEGDTTGGSDASTGADAGDTTSAASTSGEVETAGTTGSEATGDPDTTSAGTTMPADGSDTAASTGAGATGAEPTSSDPGGETGAGGQSDTGAQTGTDGETPTSSATGSGGETGGDPSHGVPTDGCACAGGGAGPAPLLVLVALASRRRRRR